MEGLTVYDFANEMDYYLTAQGTPTFARSNEETRSG